MRVGDEFKRLSVFDVEEPVMKAAANALEQEAGALENITGALSYHFELSNEGYFVWMAPYADKFGLDWLIINIIPESDFMAQIYAGNRQTAILIGLSLLVSIIFAALITVWITRPLLQLNDSARVFASGDWGRRVSANRTDEIGELSQSFNNMAEQIQASFESIRVSEKRYQSLFEDSPVSLWEEDGSQLKQHLDELRAAGITNWKAYFEGHPEELRACVGLIKVKEVNRATMAIFGADTKEAFSNGLSPFLTEKSVKALRDELIALAEGNYYYETEANCQTLKGAEIIVHIRLSIIPGYEDTWSKLLLSLEDITQRKQAEENLRLSEARYRAVVENQTEFIVRWKTDGVRTFANEAYLRYFGLTPEQAASSSFMPLVAEEDRSVVEGKISRLLSGSVDSETEIHRVINPDGSIGWQEWVDQAMKDETGQILECQSGGRDITLRKQAEEALREKRKNWSDSSLPRSTCCASQTQMGTFDG
jgi:PAS domain S-box-containing protein